VDEDLIAAGGFTGELVVARLRSASASAAAGDDDQPPAAAAAEDESASSEEDEEAAAARRGWRGGGFAGGMACGFGSVGRHCKLVYSGRITQCENGITNGIEISRTCERLIFVGGR